MGKSVNIYSYIVIYIVIIGRLGTSCNRPLKETTGN